MYPKQSLAHCVVHQSLTSTCTVIKNAQLQAVLWPHLLKRRCVFGWRHRREDWQEQMVLWELLAERKVLIDRRFFFMELCELFSKAHRQHQAAIHAQNQENLCQTNFSFTRVILIYGVRSAFHVSH